ncbi:cytochrome c1 [Paracoccus marinaquae]|uniref:cytochrome c1 n=1 Tax=Paracoccus marinaquae TaxID=2841926 RepID=UPI003D69A095
MEAEEAAEPTVAEGETTGEEEEAAAEEEAGEEEAEAHIEDIAFSFEGPFGKYDQFQLQRGLQVYTEVCSACHGLKFVPIRTLADEGGPALPENQVRAYAAGLTEVLDPETDEERPRLPTDHFPAISGDGMGPDLSLMAKARAGFHGPYGTGMSQLFNGIGGPEYIHAILTDYTGEEMEQAGSVFYQNTAFSGGYIAMPAPLSDDLVTYEDGTPATVDQMARDVSAFLMWTAEPKMMDRKQVGLVSVLFLIVLTALLYLTNKRLWAPHKGKHLGS